MKKVWLAFALVCSVPLLMAGSCGTTDSYRSANMLGVIKLGPFPRQGRGVGGYNLYLSKNRGGAFEKINSEPVLGGSSLMVPYLAAGKTYYFYMTAVGRRDPTKESVPGPIFQRTAKQSWN